MKKQIFANLIYFSIALLGFSSLKISFAVADSNRFSTAIQMSLSGQEQSALIELDHLENSKELDLMNKNLFYI